MPIGASKGMAQVYRCLWENGAYEKQFCIVNLLSFQNHAPTATGGKDLFKLRPVVFNHAGNGVGDGDGVLGISDCTAP